MHKLRSQSIRVVLMRSWQRSDFSGVGDPLACLSAATRASECAVPAPKRHHLTDAVYEYLGLTVPGVTTVGIKTAMCPDWPLCSPLFGRVPVWRDEGHYSARALRGREGDIWARLARTGYFDRAT